MPHAANLVMHNSDMIATSRPFFSDDVILVEEDGWPNRATIALGPLLEPECNRGISFEKGAIVRNDSVACAMHLKEWYGACWMATAGHGRICARDGGERGETSGEFAGQHIGHTTAIGETGGEYFVEIDAQC